MKNIPGVEAKFNVLIYAKPEKVEHKMRDVIDKENSKLKDGEDDPDWKSGWCWWTLSKPPKRDEILTVLFTDGVNVFAEGDFLGTTDDAVEFLALRRVCYPQPKKAPARGFTYVEIDEFGRFKKETD